MHPKSKQFFSSGQRVQIHENHIHSLAREDFANMQGSDKFDFLNLARNSLKKLQANVFYDLRTLNSLDLDSNKIIVIDDEAFDGIQGNILGKQWSEF